MPDPLWINAVSGTPAYSARELRRAQAAGWFPFAEAGDAGRLDVRPGVRPGGSVVVTVSSFTATVHPFAASVAPRLTEDQGSYVVQHTGASHAIDPADGTDPRIDLIVVRIYDDDEDTSGRREAVTEYIAGSPASSPTAPAVPSGAMELARIDVPADGNGAPTVTNTASYTVGSGGVLPARDSSEYPTGGRYSGMMVWDQSSEELLARVPGGWAPVGLRWDQPASTHPYLGEQGTYTPVLTAGSTDPTLGSDGTINGSWHRIGNLVHVSIRFQFGSSGSGADGGSGNYFVSLPFTPNYTHHDPAWSGTTATAAGLGIPIGTASSRDNDTLTNSAVGAAIIVLDDRIAIVSTGSGDPWGSGHPFAWQANDRATIQASYILDPTAL